MKNNFKILYGVFFVVGLLVGASVNGDALYEISWVILRNAAQVCS